LKKKSRTNQELELLEKALGRFPFFEEILKVLPKNLFRALLLELKYDTKAKHTIISKQGIINIHIYCKNGF